MNVNKATFAKEENDMNGRSALVTGASDGIGVEFCELLGARVYHVGLVALYRSGQS